MKTLALTLMLIMTVNAMAAVSTWDTTSFADVDPWEIAVEEVVEETVVGSSSFSA